MKIAFKFYWLNFYSKIIVFSFERFQKIQKRRNVRSDVLGTGPSKKKAREGTFEAAPVVSR